MAYSGRLWGPDLALARTNTGKTLQRCFSARYTELSLTSTICRLTLFQDKKDALDLNFATGCDEFKIICNPFFGCTGSSQLFYDRCYDVLYIGKLKRGGSRITMSLEKRGGKDFAVLKSEWAHFRTKGMKEWVSPGFTSRHYL